MITAYMFKNKIVYYYDSLIVDCHGESRITLYSNSLPNWKSPYKRFKIKYLQGLGFGLSPRGFDNPQDIEKALELLKNSVSEFNIKPNLF